jgi:hypothetical protein
MPWRRSPTLEWHSPIQRCASWGENPILTLGRQSSRPEGNMRPQSHGKANETKGRVTVALIASVSGFLVALGTLLNYVHAWLGDQLRAAISWAPQLLSLTVKLAGQGLWDSFSVSTIHHWMTLSAASMMMLGLLAALRIAWKRRTAS